MPKVFAHAWRGFGNARKQGDRTGPVSRLMGDLGPTATSEGRNLGGVEGCRDMADFAQRKFLVIF
jgi:hypothetical protein